MTTLTIPIEDNEREQLQAQADKLGVRLEELAHLSIKSILFQQDEEFTRTMKFVLSRNSELYKRLA